MPLTARPAVYGNDLAGPLGFGDNRMTLSDLSIVSVISGLAVLGSLVYLARQTQQNVKHTRALIQQGRSVQAADLTNRWAADPSWIVLLQRGCLGDPNLNDDQVLRFLLMQFSAYQMWEDYDRIRSRCSVCDLHNGRICH